jgi:hypothetical protein
LEGIHLLLELPETAHRKIGFTDNKRLSARKTAHDERFSARCSFLGGFVSPFRSQVDYKIGFGLLCMAFFRLQLQKPT